jgi:hypothetical protein
VYFLISCLVLSSISLRLEIPFSQNSVNVGLFKLQRAAVTTVLQISIFCIILRLNSYFSQNILAISKGGRDALRMRKVVRTDFQPENLKERNRLENDSAGVKTLFK